MYLKDDKLTVTIGSVTMFSHTQGLGLPAFVLDPDAVTGWTDGVDVRRDITPRALAWGDFREQGYMASRVIAVTGAAVATTPQELHFMRDVLVGLVSTGGHSTIEVTNLTGTRYSSVTLSSAPVWVQKSDTVAVWKLELYADDPRVYGPLKSVRLAESATIGGLMYPIRYPINYNTGEGIANVIRNTGNSKSYPTFVVTGDFYSGFVIEDGRGSSVIYSGTVSTHAPVTIDMMKQTASQSGFDRSTYLMSRNFFSIDPGVEISPKFTPLASGTGWCDIMYRDTWI